MTKICYNNNVERKEREDKIMLASEYFKGFMQGNERLVGAWEAFKNFMRGLRYLPYEQYVVLR